MYEFSLLTEFDEELHDRTLRAEGYEEGYAEGYAEARAEARAEFIEKLIPLFAEIIGSGRTTKESILSRFALSEEEVMRLDEALASNASTL